MGWFVILVLIAVTAVLGFHIYRRGPAATTEAVVALVGTIVAGIIAFITSFTG